MSCGILIVVRNSSSLRTSKKVAAAGELPTRTNSSKAKITVGPTVTVKGKIFLSAEQKKVLSLVVDEGKNIFFTGSAGALSVIFVVSADLP